MRLVSLTVLAGAALAAAPGLRAQSLEAPPAATTATRRAAQMPQQLPFSQAVRAGNLLFVSGTLGTDSTGRLVTGGIEAETRQTMQNIKAIVERNGTTMDNVVKCLVMLADMAEWGRMNSVYVTFFPNRKPARSAFGASGLALNARVEIECIAEIK
ncbi:MAG: RidA family protein [Gemmatimonadales bacterium]